MTAMIDLSSKFLNLLVHNALRADEVSVSLTTEQALSNAPQSDGEFFSVPKVLDDTSA